MGSIFYLTVVTISWHTEVLLMSSEGQVKIILDLESEGLMWSSPLYHLTNFNSCTAPLLTLLQPMASSLHSTWQPCFCCSPHAHQLSPLPGTLLLRYHVLNEPTLITLIKITICLQPPYFRLTFFCSTSRLLSLSNFFVSCLSLPLEWDLEDLLPNALYILDS